MNRELLEGGGGEGACLFSSKRRVLDRLDDCTYRSTSVGNGNPQES